MSLKKSHAILSEPTGPSGPVAIRREPFYWVKIQSLFENQQVTNAPSKLVETSEAIRPRTYSLRNPILWRLYPFGTPYGTYPYGTYRDFSGTPYGASGTTRYSKEELSWNQWLAGVIDGDGCLLISPKGYMSCVITMGLRDEHALQQIKAKLGGSVKLRSGCRAIRYRLHHKKGMQELVHRIQGEIRTGVRQKQFQLLCEKLGFIPADPSPLSRENAWFAGFFDADGTITLSVKRGIPQVTISVTNKKAQDLLPFQESFSGNIFYDKATNCYKWSIQGKADLLSFLDYIKKYPVRSSKKSRFFLLPRFFELTQDQSYKADLESLRYKAWTLFLEKWISYTETTSYASHLRDLF